jgi:hypothetical protein
MQSESTVKIAENLAAEGYSGLFLSNDPGLADSIWLNGENRVHLERIVQDSHYPDLTRLLASELLYAEAPDYPPEEWGDTLAYLYSQALAITGDKTGPFRISGNQWGFMYHFDELGIKDYGALGIHLVNIGPTAIPYLTKLLDNPDIILYEGSEEATLGNSLDYRVKDAAAYYIGQISGIPVKFYEQTADRDAEIKRLKETLKNDK